MYDIVFLSARTLCYRQTNSQPRCAPRLTKHWLTVSVVVSDAEVVLPPLRLASPNTQLFEAIKPSLLVLQGHPSSELLCTPVFLPPFHLIWTIDPLGPTNVLLPIEFACERGALEFLKMHQFAIGIALAFAAYPSKFPFLLVVLIHETVFVALECFLGHCPSTVPLAPLTIIPDICPVTAIDLVVITLVPLPEVFLRWAIEDG